MKAQPRFAGVDIFITRRVHNREFRLRPSKKVNQIVKYVVAILAPHYGIELNALLAMSSHYHARCFDPFGNASNFARDCHAIIAKLIIRHFGDKDETLWSPVPTNVVEDEIEDGAIDHIAYTMTDPVKSGLVKYAKSWPGAKGRWPQRDQTIERPPGFFQEDNWSPEQRTESGQPRVHWAKTATLHFTRPRGYDHLSDNELALAIDQAIKRREREAHAKWKGVEGAFPGRRAVLNASRRQRAVTEERKGNAKRVPTVRVRDPERRIERLSGIREWRVNYRWCLREWPTNRDVVFPYGTYKMRVVHGVRVHEPPT